MIKILQLSVFLLMLHQCHVIGLQITRSKDGDRVPGLFCEKGTLIFRDDETHSLQCITKMHEAGCMLSFFDSRNVKCVEESGINEYYVIPRNVQTFCSEGHQVSAGDIQLQNYPNSIRASVWYTGHGVKEVEKGIEYVELQNTKVIFRFTKYWPGFVIKLNFVCKNATGHVTEKSEENCVILKNVGFTPYPLEKHTFIPATLIPSTTSTVPTQVSVTKGQGASDGNQTTENHQPLVLPYFSNDELMFALLCAFGLSFIIVSICLTLLCIRYIRREKMERRAKTGEGNEGFVTEEAIEVVVAREEAIQISPRKKTKKKKKFLRQKTGKGKLPLDRTLSTTTKQNETPPPTTTSSRLHFSPVVSTDSNRPSSSQPNLFNAIEDGLHANLKEGLNYGEGTNGTHSGDNTVTDDVLNHYGSTTPRGFKESLLHQFTNDQHNIFHDNDDDDEHVYAQVHDRLSNRESPNHETHESPHAENRESPKTDVESVNSNHQARREENFQHIEEHSGFDQQDLYATVIRKKPETGRKTLSELRHFYSSASDGKTSSSSPEKSQKENEDEITIDLDENSSDHRPANETTITLNDNTSVNRDSYIGDISSTNEEKDEQFVKYNRTSLKKVSSRAALWERGNLQSPARIARDSSEENSSRKSVRQMWQERDTVSSLDGKFSSPFRRKPNSMTSKYNRDKHQPPSSPKMSIKDIWRKRAEESNNNSPSHSIERNNSNASGRSVTASATSLSADDFANEGEVGEANMDMSESIEAMFDMEDDVMTAGEGTEEESFADILRKQMMF